MRKYFLVLITVLTISLVSCKTSTTVDVEIIKDAYTSSTNTYEYEVTIKKEIKNNDDLNEIVNDTSRQIYNNLFDEIGKNKRLLIITFNMEIDNELINIGKITFEINKNDENPGLTLIDNLVKLN